MKKLTTASKYCPILFILLLFKVSSSYCQTLTKEHQEAYALFHAGKYTDALEKYEQLYLYDINDKSVNFYLGICYLKTNSRPLTGIDRLTYCTQNNYNEESFYYLAKAYYHTYQFENAQNALLNFEKIAKRKIKKRLKSPQLLKQIIRARQMFGAAADVSGVLRKDIEKNSLLAYLNERLSQHNIKASHSPQTQGAYTISFSNINAPFSFGVTHNKGKQNLSCFSQSGNAVKRGNLKKLNSKANEAFPFFDSDKSVLYFSSDRAGGFGGYDIYKVAYNKKSKSFGSPILLPFPINSTKDDFFYLPFGKNEALIGSNRLCPLNQVSVYTIKPDLKLVDYSNLDYKKRLAQSNFKINTSRKPKTTKARVVKDPQSGAYSKLLGFALESQLSADSLQFRLVQLKNELREESTTDKRKVIFSKIARVKRQLNYYKTQADKYFDNANALKGSEQKHKNASSVNGTTMDVKTSTPPAIVRKKNIDGTTYYKYNTRPSTKKPQTNTYSNTLQAPPLGFSVANSTPYSAKRPIPKNITLPDGLRYRIQLGVFQENIAYSNFKGLSPLSSEKVMGKNLTRYFVGVFVKITEAKLALGQVKKEGFSDAFIIAYHNNQRISLQRAREIEFGGMR